MNAEPQLLLRLLAAMAAMLGVAALLAHGLRRPLRPEAWIAATALPLYLLLPWLTGDRILLPTGNLARGIPGSGVPAHEDPWALVLNDVSLDLAPWEIEVRRQLAAGRLPFWSDRRDGGSSPWADPQVSVLSPTSMLARLLPARHHFLAALALKIQLAWCGAWVAARMLGSGRRGALFAASAFAIGGGILAWGLFPHSSVAAWTPWSVAAGLGLARHPGARVWAAAVTAVFASMLSGQPEVAFATGVLTAIVSFFYARRGTRWRALARVASTGAIAFGLAAPVLVPFLAIAPSSQRALDRGLELERARAGGGAGENASKVWSRRWEILSAPLSPWAGGVPFASGRVATRLYTHSGYTGLTALAGAAAALALRGARRRAVPLLLAAVAISSFAAGLPPFDTLWNHTPGVQLQEPTRTIPLAALCIALAGAVGLDRWLRSRRQGTSRAVAAAVALALAFGFAVAPASGVAALASAIAMSALLGARTPRLAIVVLGLALLSDQIPWGRRLLPPGDPRLFYPETKDVQTIVRVAGGPGGRAVGHDVLTYPSILSTYQLSDPRTHNPLASARYNRVLASAFGFAPDMWHYFGRFRNPAHPLLDFLGVRAVISNRNLPPIPAMRQVPLSRFGFFVAENRDALPRAFVTRRFDRIEARALPDWIAAMTDPRRVALDPTEIDGRMPRAGLHDGHARVVVDRDAHLAIEVRGTGHRLLATSLRGPSGWHVRTGDGRPLEPLSVNGCFVGLVVPPRVGRVELRYRPPGLGLGLVLAGLSLLSFGTAMLFCQRRGRIGVVPPPRRGF